jgi:hypothetical protein
MNNKDALYTKQLQELIDATYGPQYTLERLPEERKQQWTDTATELWELKLQYKRIGEIISQLESKLKLISHHETFSDGVYIYEKTFQKGTVQYKDIPELKGIDVDIYRGPEVERWKLSKV